MHAQLKGLLATNAENKALSILLGMYQKLTPKMYLNHFFRSGRINEHIIDNDRVKSKTAAITELC